MSLVCERRPQDAGPALPFALCLNTLFGEGHLDGFLTVQELIRLIHCGQRQLATTIKRFCCKIVLDLQNVLPHHFLVNVIFKLDQMWPNMTHLTIYSCAEFTRPYKPVQIPTSRQKNPFDKYILKAQPSLSHAQSTTPPDALVPKNNPFSKHLRLQASSSNNQTIQKFAKLGHFTVRVFDNNGMEQVGNAFKAMCDSNTALPSLVALSCAFNSVNEPQEIQMLDFRRALLVLGRRLLTRLDFKAWTVLGDPNSISRDGGHWCRLQSLQITGTQFSYNNLVKLPSLERLHLKCITTTLTLATYPVRLKHLWLVGCCVTLESQLPSSLETLHVGAFGDTPETRRHLQGRMLPKSLHQLHCPHNAHPMTTSIQPHSICNFLFMADENVCWQREWPTRLYYKTTTVFMANWLLGTRLEHTDTLVEWVHNSPNHVFTILNGTLDHEHVYAHHIDTLVQIFGQQLTQEAMLTCIEAAMYPVDNPSSQRFRFLVGMLNALVRRIAPTTICNDAKLSTSVDGVTAPSLDTASIHIVPADSKKMLLWASSFNGLQNPIIRKIFSFHSDNDWSDSVVYPSKRTRLITFEKWFVKLEPEVRLWMQWLMKHAPVLQLDKMTVTIGPKAFCPNGDLTHIIRSGGEPKKTLPLALAALDIQSARVPVAETIIAIVDNVDISSVKTLSIHSGATDGWLDGERFVPYEQLFASMSQLSSLTSLSISFVSHFIRATQDYLSFVQMLPRTLRLLNVTQHRIHLNPNFQTTFVFECDDVAMITTAFQFMPASLRHHTLVLPFDPASVDLAAVYDNHARLKLPWSLIITSHNVTNSNNLFDASMVGRNDPNNGTPFGPPLPAPNPTNNGGPKAIRDSL